MKPVRCNKCKLFYDSESYTQCPYCQEAEEKIDVSDEVVDIPSVEEEESKVILSVNKNDENSFTPHSVNVHPHVVAVVKSAEPEEPEIPEIPAVPEVPEIVDEPFCPAEPEDEPQEEKELVDDLQADAVPEKPATITNCTVGWLVCLNGEYFGKSFVLKPEHNFIGRDSEMQVSLPEEKSLLNQNHAAVFYNQSVNKFGLIPGDARGLTYLNGELKVSECLLKPGDKISLGDVNFIFVPLCGSRFKWDEYLK